MQLDNMSKFVQGFSLRLHVLVTIASLPCERTPAYSAETQPLPRITMPRDKLAGFKVRGISYPALYEERGRADVWKSGGYSVIKFPACLIS